jgi:hypothetical protein
MTDSCYFLPSIRYSQNKASCKKQKSTQLQTISIFLKRTPQKHNMHWARNSLLKRKKTPNYCPLGQCRCCMIRASALSYWLVGLRPTTLGGRVSGRAILFCYCENFCNRSNKITSTIPKQNKKTKKQEKLRSKKNQIQSHLFAILFSWQKRDLNP